MPQNAVGNSGPTPNEAKQQEPPSTPQESTAPAPVSGREAFRDIRRRLTEQDLASPGTQKLLLEMLLSAETERDEIKAYIPKYYAAERQAAVLEEKAKPNKINETLSGFGLALGGAIIGVAPFFWTVAGYQGWICLVMGAFLVIGATIGRVKFK